MEQGSMSYFSNNDDTTVLSQYGWRTLRRGWWRTGEGDGVDVLLVVGEGHVFLSETDGVLALTDPVKVLELVFGDAPFREVDLHGENAYVARTGWDVEGHGASLCEDGDSGFREIAAFGACTSRVCVRGLSQFDVSIDARDDQQLDYCTLKPYRRPRIFLGDANPIFSGP